MALKPSLAVLALTFLLGVPAISNAATSSTTQTLILKKSLTNLLATASTTVKTPWVGTVNEAKIIASSTIPFGFPHGTMERNGTIILGTVRENPAHIVLFPNLHNLHTVLATTTPGFMNLASVDYDSVHQLYYFAATRTANKHLEIISVDPNTLAWKPVYEFPSVAEVGYPAITTDGSSVYVATQSNPGYLLKVDATNWVLQKSSVHPEVTGGFHSALLENYPSREEWYVNTFASSTSFYKIDPGTLVADSVLFAAVPRVTDDIYFRPNSSSGGTVYDVSEAGGGIAAIDTSSMTAMYHPSLRGYGVFSDGTDMYVVNPFDSGITKYSKFNLDDSSFIHMPGKLMVNEWFPNATPRTGFFTTFATSSALYEYSY